MSSKLSILDSTQLARILDDAFHLLLSPGIKIESAEASELLCSAGAIVQDGRVRIPAQLVEKSLAAVPREFSLYDRAGHPAVRYGGDAVHFDPGSSCLNVLDSETLQPRPATSADLAQLIQVAEMLPQFAAQSTAVVCCDVPSETLITWTVPSL